MNMLSFLSLFLTAAETTAAEVSSAAITFTPFNFVVNLKYMLSGMLVIFVLIGVIILTTLLVNKFFSRQGN